MSRMILVLALAVPLISGCTTAYKSADAYEQKEHRYALVNVSPDEVRAHLDRYTNSVVAWAGIIKDTDAYEDGKDYQIRAVSTLEHHYYDWKVNHKKFKAPYCVSSRGEGLFRVEWFMKRVVDVAGSRDAEDYAAPGKLALVYGTPLKVEDDGVVVLKYHYLRVLKSSDVDARSFDYGRPDATPKTAK